MNKHGRFFFFNDTPTTETYTLSLHDALPISLCRIKRVPEARLCTRSCSWDSSLTTRGGSPVRELRPPGSVRGASSNGCPYRDNHLLSCIPPPAQSAAPGSPMGS